MRHVILFNIQFHHQYSTKNVNLGARGCEGIKVPHMKDAFDFMRIIVVCEYSVIPY